MIFIFFLILLFKICNLLFPVNSSSSLIDWFDSIIIIIIINDGLIQKSWIQSRINYYYYENNVNFVKKKKRMKEWTTSQSSSMMIVMIKWIAIKSFCSKLRPMLLSGDITSPRPFQHSRFDSNHFENRSKDYFKDEKKINK